MPPTVRVRFSMEFELPERMSSGDHKRLARLVRAARYLNGCADSPDGFPADRHHFADAVDAIETLANVARRARASSGE